MSDALKVLSYGRLRTLGTSMNFCNTCGESIDMSGEPVLLAHDVGDKILAAPLNLLHCPHCNTSIGIVNVYKAIDVTDYSK